MKFLIYCENSDCKFYFEDSCLFTGEKIALNASGTCESFEEGENELYELTKNIEFEDFDNIT